jgi:hypothetical protein
MIPLKNSDKLLPVLLSELLSSNIRGNISVYQIEGLFVSETFQRHCYTKMTSNGLYIGSDIMEYLTFLWIAPYDRFKHKDFD